MTRKIPLLGGREGEIIESTGGRKKQSSGTIAKKVRMVFDPVVLGTNRCGEDLPALLGCAEKGLDEVLYVQFLFCLYMIAC